MNTPPKRLMLPTLLMSKPDSAMANAFTHKTPHTVCTAASKTAAYHLILKRSLYKSSHHMSNAVPSRSKSKSEFSFAKLITLSISYHSIYSVIYMLFFKPIPNLPCRNSGYNTVRRNIFCYYCAGGDDTAIAYMHSRKD